MNRRVERECEAGFVFALDTEADRFAHGVTDSTVLRGAGGAFHVGTFAGKPVAWVVSGMGIGPASRAATMLLEGHRPSLLVSAGFAGGLDPSLPRGSLVLPARGLRGASPPCDFLPLSGTIRGAVSCDAIVTVDAVVATRAGKRDLRETTGAAVVDMETHGVASVASAAGVPCLSVRVVSDAADDELPADVARLVIPQSPLRRAGAALAAIGRQPATAATLWRLWENSVVDGRTLATALAEIVATCLPDRP